MGDAPLSLSSPSNQPFVAGQMFDPRSAYGRMRASLKPEAKLRGFFHYLTVLAKEQSKEEPARAGSAARGRRPLRLFSLALSTGDPGREWPIELQGELADRFAGKRQLHLSFQVRDSAGRPAAPAACRALILTPAMLERLCGQEATRGPEAVRAALLRLFAGQSAGDPFETSRVLAAIPELDGELDETGFCRFRPVDLPEHATVVKDLPEGTLVVLVIDSPTGG